MCITSMARVPAFIDFLNKRRMIKVYTVVDTSSKVTHPMMVGVLVAFTWPYICTYIQHACLYNSHYFLITDEIKCIKNLTKMK